MHVYRFLSRLHLWFVSVEIGESSQSLNVDLLQFGGQKYEQVKKTSVYCKVLPGIECFGPRRFLRGGFPCIRCVARLYKVTEADR